MRWLLPALVMLSLVLAGQAAEAPRRVVSMNVCTDQLALLIAAPGQVISVSGLGSDPRTSAMPEVAAALPANSGMAEEVFLMTPDLVLAGTYGAGATVSLLRRLGVTVEAFPPVTSLEELRTGILRMGSLLGQQARATDLLARFDADLAAFAPLPGGRPGVATWYANGFTTGSGTLTDALISAAGFRNIAGDLGLAGGGVLPLEQLIMAQPEMVITGRPYPGDSRSEEVLRHPALVRLMQERAGAALADADWLCGTPFVLRAVAELRQAWENGAPRAGIPKAGAQVTPPAGHTGTVPGWPAGAERMAD